MTHSKYTLPIALSLALLSCTSYRAYQRADEFEKDKQWDKAVAEYNKALEVDPDNIRYRMGLQRARMEASRAHFEKGKTLRAAGHNDLAAIEFEIVVKLDPTNQYAAVELAKAVNAMQEAARSADRNSLEERKRRAAGISKAQPPQLNPSSNEPIFLSFPRETPVKDIYRALGNSYGINILFDQQVKDDRITIELRDVTAQPALERVMQAANHFYKILDEKTIIIIPDTPQARRDYEDLVIQTFYLSNGDAEQVTNVIRTMLEARNVFPLKALNAITIRDTADKVRIAEKIIEANDKAKAEVVIDVELLQLDVTKAREIGAQLTGLSAGILNFTTYAADGKPITGAAQTIDALRNATSDNWTFNVPSITYAFVKSNTDAQLLAKPRLRISEGEKATLHIGQRVPVPTTTFNTGNTVGGNIVPITSFQYQDVGIKISIEPRVHHNREVTLKLTVEVSNLAGSISGGDGSPAQPIIGTRNIDSTIRLKDGETNFLAGLIRKDDALTRSGLPFLGDIPILGRFVTKEKRDIQNTDVVLTMTPHIIRIPDITDDDLAPMWVGTSNNLTFRGVSPRIEAANGADPFNVPMAVDETRQFQEAPSTPVDNSAQFGFVGKGRATPAPPQQTTPGTNLNPGGQPTDPFGPPPPTPPPPTTPPNPELSRQTPQGGYMTPASPRIAPQPMQVTLTPGKESIWSITGMDLEGLSTPELIVRYDPRAMDLIGVSIGTAFTNDPQAPIVSKIDSLNGIVRILSSDGSGLQFRSGGELLALRVRGLAPGNTEMQIAPLRLVNAKGEVVVTGVAAGRARIE